MKLLLLADDECSSIWDYYTPGKLSGYDAILSAGDLKSEYLTFLVTMSNRPLVYIHGNHDTNYEKKPPEGCICADDRLITVGGLRILGLGGCRNYNGGQWQFSEQKMKARIRKLELAVRCAGGVDIILTHTPPLGYGDAEDYAHIGFECFLPMIDKWKPKVLVHGHIHKTYGRDIPREIEYNGTRIINAYERYDLELPDPDPDTVSRYVFPNLKLIRKKDVY